MIKEYKIGIIGLGYVGLPLSIAFAEKYKVVGYDINNERVSALKNGIDKTKEVETAQFETNFPIHFTSDLKVLSDCNIYIVTVPTPIDKDKQPDLSFLINASKSIGSILKIGDIVIYESTVYPGCTEEECVPVLESSSGLKFNQDFYVGYSPERINPGDRARPIQSIIKVTSGSTPEIATTIDSLYKSIITAGTYLAPTIKVAEASKAIENAQRDVNISFMNELALIFDKLDIDIDEVLDAAKTKWNFLSFKPGLVGGHCIGVDPHYLAFKAKQVGYMPNVILSGREINDSMSQYLALKFISILQKKYDTLTNRTILMLGLSYKENLGDLRNSKVLDIIEIFNNYGLSCYIYDPFVMKNRIQESQNNFEFISTLSNYYDGIFVSVAHDLFSYIDFKSYYDNGSLIFDTTHLVDRNLICGKI